MLLKFLGGVVLALLVVVALLTFGPREPVNLTSTFDSSSLGSDLDAYLLEQEAKVSDIKPGAEKQIAWLSPETKAKQPYAIVYLHGFSASLAEIRPIPKMIANEIRANIFYTRFVGHGREGKAMAEGNVNGWWRDMNEAIAIGKQIGEKVIILATSTGGTLATLAATNDDLMKNVAGMVMVSPNYAVQAAGSEILTLGFARHFIPTLLGEERSWEPKNEAQRQWWSTQYPNVALIPMQTAVDLAGNVTYENLKTPALFIFHPKDGVVKSEVSEQVALRWGTNGHTKAEIFKIQSSDDTMNHVIAGDILSPENNTPVANKAIAWIKSL